MTVDEVRLTEVVATRRRWRFALPRRGLDTINADWRRDTATRLRPPTGAVAELITTCSTDRTHLLGMMETLVQAVG